MGARNLNLSTLVASPMDQQMYRAKSAIEIFGTFRYHSSGTKYEQEVPKGAETVLDADMATLLATITSPEEGDYINPTGITLVLHPSNGVIGWWKTLSKWKCGLPV